LRLAVIMTSIVLALVFGAGAGQAETRLVLVIGNGGYSHANKLASRSAASQVARRP